MFRILSINFSRRRACGLAGMTFLALSALCVVTTLAYHFTIQARFSRVEMPLAEFAVAPAPGPELVWWALDTRELQRFLTAAGQSMGTGGKSYGVFLANTEDAEKARVPGIFRTASRTDVLERTGTGFVQHTGSLRWRFWRWSVLRGSRLRRTVGGEALVDYMFPSERPRQPEYESSPIDMMTAPASVSLVLLIISGGFCAVAHMTGRLAQPPSGT
jgi:hypothetical protein